MVVPCILSPFLSAGWRRSGLLVSGDGLSCVMRLATPVGRNHLACRWLTPCLPWWGNSSAYGRNSNFRGVTARMPHDSCLRFRHCVTTTSRKTRSQAVHYDFARTELSPASYPQFDQRTPAL